MNTNTDSLDNTAAEALPSDLRQMNETQFAQFGVSRVAFIKPVLIDGKRVFAIHAANGLPMALAEDPDTAAAAIVQHEMIPASVH